MTSEERAIPVPPTGGRTTDLENADLLARHAALTARDEVIGLEATVARLEAELAASRRSVRRLRARLEARGEESATLRASWARELGRRLARRIGRR